MQYHLDTIPVWAAIEAEYDCLFCWLQAKCESDEVTRALGGSVMEPDERIRINKTGICARHHKKLYDMNNRLGHALLMDSHVKEILDAASKMEPLTHIRKKPFSRADDACSALAAAFDDINKSCVLCENIQSHMERYLYTFVHLWKTDKAFQTKWKASKGMCLVHAADVLKAASKHLHGGENESFAVDLLTMEKQALTADEKDLEWFTLKFDYRNQSKPWGNSKNAPERMANRLRSQCIGEIEFEDR